MQEVLEQFGPATREWFEAAFAAPTAAQAGAWRAIGAGRNALVVAPTGSGKTLAAFLWSLDRLAREPVPADARRRCRVLYVSPLKALAVDVERNLRAPLTGIRQAAGRLGVPPPDITVGMRTGDTPADERRSFARTPPDILITTPESLFLLLTSAARESLRGVETVIVDEVHAVAATKRGAHLALSLERLDALLARPAQRIGLSATVRPIDETARFLGGAHAVEIVQPPSAKTIEVRVEVPVEDMTRLDEVPDVGLRRSRRGGRHAPVDLAGRRGAGARPDRGAPVDDRLHQLAARRRAALRPAQRAGRRAGRADPAGSGPAARRDHGAGRAGRRRAAGGRPRPPRQRLPRGAQADRGGAQVRAAAGRGGHLQPGARHRHGRGRPGRADRGAAVGRRRAAAHRPGRAPGRRGLPRRGLPQAPRRPGLLRGGRRADGRRRDRGAALPAQPARRAGPADRRDGRAGPVAGRRAGRAGPPGRALRRAARLGAARRARHALRPLPVDRLRRAAAPAGLGPRHRRADRPAGRAAARRHQRRHHPRPGPVRRLPGRRRAGVPGRRARRGDGLRVAGRRRLPARLDLLADRGHHPRPGAGLPRARRAGADAVLEGRLARPAGRAGPGHRRPAAVARPGPATRRPRPRCAARGWTSGPPAT